MENQITVKDKYDGSMYTLTGEFRVPEPGEKYIDGMYSVPDIAAGKDAHIINGVEGDRFARLIVKPAPEYYVVTVRIDKHAFDDLKLGYSSRAGYAMREAIKAGAFTREVEHKHKYACDVSKDCISSTCGRPAKCECGAVRK